MVRVTLDLTIFGVALWSAASAFVAESADPRSAGGTPGAPGANPRSATIEPKPNPGSGGATRDTDPGSVSSEPATNPGSVSSEPATERAMDRAGTEPESGAREPGTDSGTAGAHPGTAAGRESTDDPGTESGRGSTDPGTTTGTAGADPGTAAASSASARMQPIRNAITLRPGASCLELTQLVGVISGEHRLTEVDARLSLEIVGDPEDSQTVVYRVFRDGELAGAKETRSESRDCDQLHMVVAFRAAFMFDMTTLPDTEPDPVVTRAPAMPDEPEAPAEDDSERAPDLEARPRREEAYEPSPWHGAVVVFGGIGFDAPPDIGGVGGAAVELRWRDYVDVSAGVLGARSNAQAAGAGRAVYSLVGAKVDVCGALVVRQVRPRGCAGVIGGGALATGTAFARPDSSRLPWLATTFGFDLRIEIAPRLELEFGADGLVHLLQPAFDFLDEDGTRRVGREFPWIGGWVTAGLVVNFR